MKDKEFLQWIHDRLENRFRVNHFEDYMHQLRAIIEATPDDADSYHPTVSCHTSEVKE